MCIRDRDRISATLWAALAYGTTAAMPSPQRQTDSVSAILRTALVCGLPPAMPLPPKDSMKGVLAATHHPRVVDDFRHAQRPKGTDQEHRCKQARKITL